MSALRKIPRPEDRSGALYLAGRLLAGVLLWYGVRSASLIGLRSLLGALFTAWGVDQASWMRAPGWAQLLYRLHGDLCYTAAYGLSAAAVCLYTRKSARRCAPAPGSVLRGAGLGAGLGLLAAAIVLASDCMRLERPLSSPTLSLRLFTEAIALLAACVSLGALGKRLILEGCRERLGGTAAGLVCSAALALIASVELQMFSRTSAGLIGSRTLTLWTLPVFFLIEISGLRVYRKGGTAAAAAVLAGWMLVTTLLFAWPQQSASPLYAMYTVSDSWFAGGSAGAADGVLALLLWLTAAVFLWRSGLCARLSRLRRRRLERTKETVTGQGAKKKPRRGRGEGTR